MKSMKNTKLNEVQKKKWRYHLLDYFTDIIQSEQNLDSLRQTLTQQNNFSAINIFNYLDNDNQSNSKKNTFVF